MNLLQLTQSWTENSCTEAVPHRKEGAKSITPSAECEGNCMITCTDPCRSRKLLFNLTFAFSFIEAQDQNCGKSVQIPSRSTENGICEERLPCRPAMHTREREWPKRSPTKKKQTRLIPDRWMEMKVLIREAWRGKATSAIYLDATS